MASPVIDPAARPHWLRTGYRHFPYAAQQSGRWWVLRLNHGFPEHDQYTVFIDGRAAADITGNPEDPSPLIAGAAVLGTDAGEPALDAQTATALVRAVAPYVNYGSEHRDPCLFCSADLDPMTRA